MKYTKPPLSIDRQIELLISRGMEINDHAKAERYLSHINYYRLRAYWLPFEEPSGDGNHKFKQGTKFEDGLSLYIFDRKFRLLVLEAIERIEVSFRTRFAYELSNEHGAHCYVDDRYFRDARKHAELLEVLRVEISRSQETFIRHYQRKYTEPPLPPIWMICEVMSFGQLSMWFEKIKERRLRKRIAEIYNLDEKVMASFLHHLSHVRNFAAHHGRLWNRQLTITMKLPNNSIELGKQFNFHNERKIYNTLTMLVYLLRTISPGTTWPERIKEQICSEKLVNPGIMGFPDKWQNFELWN